MTGKEYWHGTRNGYGNRKCRCDACRAANALYQKALKKKYATGRDRDGVIKTRSRHGRLSTYGLGCRCAECTSANTDYSRIKRLAESETTYPAQTDHCWCCGKIPDLGTVFDHDHSTARFRGWLCRSCNTGIGKLGDDIAGVKKALEYLEGSPYMPNGESGATSP